MKLLTVKCDVCGSTVPPGKFWEWTRRELSAGGTGQVADLCEVCDKGMQFHSRIIIGEVSL